MALLYVVLILGLLIGGTVPCIADSIQENGTCIYVSPDGDDNNNGSFEKPFRTIEKAKNYVRTIRNKTDSHITVFLRGGVYELTTPIEFDGNDAGNAMVYYRAYNGEIPILSGGRKISGWEQYDGNIFRTYIGNDVDMLQLYMDDEAKTLARWPNKDEADYGRIRLPHDTENMTPNCISVEKGTFDYVKDFSGMRAVFHNTWRTYILGITGKTVGPNYDELAIVNSHSRAFYDGQHYGAADREIYFENVYEFMDTEGEWYKGKDGYLYYYAKDGETVESMNKKDAYIPMLENLIRFSGGETSMTQNIVFDGIAFKHTKWTWTIDNALITQQANLFYDPNPDNDATYRAGGKKIRTPGAIEGSGIKNITIKNCCFNQLGGSAVYLEKFVNTVNIEGNKIYEIAGGGVEIGDDYYKAPNSWFPQNCRIANNYITKVCQQWYAGCGITALYSANTVIEHNYIKDTPYTGISANWGWDTVKPEMNHDWSIKNNRLENCMYYMSDGGYIYVPNPATSGINIVEGNYIKGSKTQISPSLNIVGLYHDAAPMGWIDKNNVVEGLQLVLFTGAQQHTVDGLWSNFNATARYRNFPATFIMNNINEVKEPVWTGDAAVIIKNAGLQKAYESLAEQKTDYNVDTEQSFYILNIGEVKHFNVSAVNNTSQEKQVTISFPNGKDMNYEMYKYTKTVTIPPNSSITVPFQLRFNDKATADAKWINATANIDGNIRNFTFACILNKVGNDTVTVIDPGYVETKGTWATSGIGGYNSISRYSGAGTAQFKMNVAGGKYSIAFFNTPHEVNTRDLKIEVFAKDKTYEFHINQNTDGASGWIDLGTFAFASGEAIVQCSSAGLPRLSAVSFEMKTAVKMEEFSQNEGSETDMHGTLAFDKNGNALKDGKDYYKFETRQIEGNTYISLRDFANYFDARIDYKDNENIIGITLGARYIEANSRNNIISINSEKYEKKKPLVIESDRMFADIEDVAGIFDMNIKKSDDGKYYLITNKNQTGIDYDSLFNSLSNMF